MGKKKKKNVFNDIEKIVEVKENKEEILIKNIKKENTKEEKIITRIYEDSVTKVM